MVSFHGREALVTLAGHRPQLARGDHEDLLPRQHGDYGEYLVGWGGVVRTCSDYGELFYCPIR